MIDPIKNIDDVELSEDTEPRNLTKAKTMAEETIFQKIKRYIKQRSTQTALGFIVTIAGFIWSGFDVSVETLTQTITGIITGAAAVYTGIMSLINLFVDEDKEKS